MTNDIYRDTDHRYRSDPAFYSAVRTLEAIAREYGFTPGELKQIAFKAALNIEETRGGQVYCVTSDERPCAHCGGKVPPFPSYLGVTGRRYCGQICYERGGR